MTKTPANDKSEAVAEANAYLNDHGLPNVHALASALKYLAQQARLTDLPASNAALMNAEKLVAQLDGLTGGNL